MILEEIFGGLCIISIFSSSRYLNGRRLPELTVGTRSSLFIANLNGAQGLYTCKATNDYGSEMSSAGELKIKGNTNVSTVVYSSNYREPEHGLQPNTKQSHHKTSTRMPRRDHRQGHPGHWPMF